MAPPFPRWLFVWAVVTFVVSAILLGFGESVTTLRAGMADPEWPTRPWHLALESKEKWTAGYLVEHTHRILGFLVGTLMSILAIAAWCYEPRKVLRWLATVGLVGLIAAFGWFHRDMIAQKDEPVVQIPIPSSAATLGFLSLTLLACLAASWKATAGTGVRILTAVTLVAVMLQGLLGGLRVRLDQLVGVELSLTHGTFATLVFALLLMIPVLMARPPVEVIPEASRRKLGALTLALVAFTLLQIGWGAWVRHAPDRMSSRLHLLFAFVVVGFATLVIKQAFADPATKRRLRWPAHILSGLITIQLLFGVEAWMGKFMTLGPVDVQRVPSVGQAILRTAHAHVGAWILGISAVLAIAVRRQPGNRVGPGDDPSVDYEDLDRPASDGHRYAATGVGGA